MSQVNYTIQHFEIQAAPGQWLGDYYTSNNLNINNTPLVSHINPNEGYGCTHENFTIKGVAPTSVIDANTNEWVSSDLPAGTLPNSVVKVKIFTDTTNDNQVTIWTYLEPTFIPAVQELNAIVLDIDGDAQLIADNNDDGSDGTNNGDGNEDDYYTTNFYIPNNVLGSAGGPNGPPIPAPNQAIAGNPMINNIENVMFTTTGNSTFNQANSSVVNNPIISANSNRVTWTMIPEEGYVITKQMFSAQDYSTQLNEAVIWMGSAYYVTIYQSPVHLTSDNLNEWSGGGQTGVLNIRLSNSMDADANETVIDENLSPESWIGNRVKVELELSSSLLQSAFNKAFYVPLVGEAVALNPIDNSVGETSSEFNVSFSVISDTNNG